MPSYNEFLVTCLGSRADEIEECDKEVLGQNCDMFAIPEAEKEDSGHGSNEENEDKEEDKDKEDKDDDDASDKPHETVCFAMDDSSDDDDDDCDSEEWDLEDAYNFDPERVAQLLKNPGVSEEELVETLQETMAEAMILRMTAEDPDVEAARPDCQGALDGRMTPPAQPNTFDAATPPDVKEVAKKLEQVPARARRSSMIRRGALDDVAKSSARNHRKSIACVASAKMEDGNKDKILQAVANSKKRHRMSMCKAVETLDLAGFGDEEDKEMVSTKLETLQKCLLVARARHRQTVAKVAMETVGGEILEKELPKDDSKDDAQKDGKDAGKLSEAKPSEEKKDVAGRDSKGDEKAPPRDSTASTSSASTFRMSASAKVFTPGTKQQSIEDKIRDAVKAAHQRAKKEQGPVEPPPKGHDEWGNSFDQGWAYQQHNAYAYPHGYDQGYNQMNQMNQMYGQGYQGQGYNQQYDPSWNPMTYQQGCPQWQQQQQQQTWMQGNGANCWMTPEGATAAYGADCYNYYGGNYSGYGQHPQQQAYAGQAWQNAAWGSA